MRSKTLWASGLGFCALIVTACEIERVAIPLTEARLAMHAVLSASAPSQVVLLERTRNGSVSQVAPPFDLEDPVVSDEGIAESGAVVTLTTPGGATLLAREDSKVRLDRKGAGIYRFALSGDSLQRGGTYHLSVTTIRGEILTAETSVPAGVAAAVPVTQVFDRARDTVVITWPASPGARSYFVRIETPYGPRSFFTDSTRVRLTGELRNIQVDGLPRVFLPGFAQAVTVSAVDSNYYDWYRSHNNTISGTGLINRVNGGIGVFGSLVRLRYQDFQVVAPQTEPEAGVFNFVGTPLEVGSTPYLSVTLYVESRSVRSDQADALSGRHQPRGRFGDPCPMVHGVLGTVQGGQVQLAFLCTWSAKDTVEILTGEIHGDTIVGRYRGFGGTAHFVRQP